MADDAAVTRVEFWPDYGPGPLWDDGGRVVELDGLGLAPELVERIRSWHGRYEEERIPVNGPGDPVWLAEGRELLAAIRAALPDVTVVVNEPWWDEPPKSEPPKAAR